MIAGTVMATITPIITRAIRTPDNVKAFSISGLKSVKQVLNTLRFALSPHFSKGGVKTEFHFTILSHVVCVKNPQVRLYHIYYVCINNLCL